MDLIAPVLAIVGVVVGSVLTFVLQRQERRDAQAADQQERLRQDRILAYSEFAGRAMEYRKAQLAHWYRNKQEPRIVTADGEAAADAARVARAALWHALFRVQLLENDAARSQSAREIVELASEIDNAPTKDEAKQRADAVRERVRAFIDHARPSVTGTYTEGRA